MEGIRTALELLTTTPLVLATLAGVGWGIIGGAIPGISTSITVALLLPFTVGMDPIIAISMLAATYVGAEYGGSIPAILIRTPGSSAAVATAIDGYEMHKKGLSGEALGISLAAGVLGGLAGMVLLVSLMGPLASVALAFTNPAYFALGVFGLSIIASLNEGAFEKALISGLVGLAVATIGSDPISGITRYTFGRPELLVGIAPILVMLGLFAVAELFDQAGTPAWIRTSLSTRTKLPSLETWRRIALPTGIGSILGAIEGCTPGGGGSVSAFLAYNEARRWSRTPEEFGKGSPEAIAAPEAANNTQAVTGLVPTLAFGIPSSGTMAVLLGGLLIHGIQPGPLLFAQQPDLIYGLFGSLFVANTGQLLLGFMLLTPCIWLVNRPKPYLMMTIYALIFSGAYSLDNSVFDLGLVLAFGCLGVAMKYGGFPVMPLVLGLVLGPIVERNYRRTLELSGGDYSPFFRDPISATLLGLSAAFICWSLYQMYRDLRRSPTPDTSDCAS